MSGGDTEDFLRYLVSADAQLAQPWQLAALAHIRSAIARPLTDREYTRLRSALRFSPVSQVVG